VEGGAKVEGAKKWRGRKMGGGEKGEGAKRGGVYQAYYWLHTRNECRKSGNLLETSVEDGKNRRNECRRSETTLETSLENWTKPSKKAETMPIYTRNE
jgi:hypothetical protein